MSAINWWRTTPGLASSASRLLASARASSVGPGGSAASAFAVRILGAAIGYGLHILLARLLGSEEFGLWATGSTALLVIGHAATGGFSGSIVRYFTAYVARGEWDRARGFIYVALAVSTGLSLVLAALGALALHLVPNLAPPALAGPLLIAAVALPAFAAQDVVEGVGRSLGRPVLALAPVYLLRPLLIGSGMTVASLTHVGLDAILAMSVTAAAMLICVLSHAIFVWRALPKPIRQAKPAYETRVWLVTSAPLGLVLVLDQLGAYADILALAFTASPAETGAYFAAARVLSLVSLAPYAVSVVAERGFADHYARGQTEELRLLARRTTRWTFFASAILLVSLFMGGPLLLALFGGDFVSAAPALAVLSLALGARAFSGHAEELLMVTGHQNARARISAVVCAVSITSCFLAAPFFGSMGVAWAMVATACVRAALFVFAAKKLTGVYTGVGQDVFIAT